MKTFEYTIKDELGIHARPAGLLVKEAKKYESECTVTVTAEGADEDAAIAGLKEFFEANL